MKNIYILFIMMILFSCTDKDITSSSDMYRNIRDMISIQDFEDIKAYILTNGDRQTYCNIYNESPHYSFSGFETYLNPEIGQKNINCDTSISDFNEIVIRDQSSIPKYYYILVVRNGDLDNEKIDLSPYDGVCEGNIYLLKNDDYNLDSMKNNIVKYINVLKSSIR